MSREAANNASSIPTCKAALPRLWNPLPYPHILGRPGCRQQAPGFENPWPKACKV